MNWPDALEIAVARSGVERLRWLCSEANPNPRTREGYRRFVLRSAGMAPPPLPAPRATPPAAATPRTVPLGESIRAARLGFRVCFYSDSRGCGCSGTYCHALGRHATLRDCVACLATEKGTPQ